METGRTQLPGKSDPSMDPALNGVLVNGELVAWAECFARISDAALAEVTRRREASNG